MVLFSRSYLQTAHRNLRSRKPALDVDLANAKQHDTPHNACGQQHSVFLTVFYSKLELRCLKLLAHLANSLFRNVVTGAWA